MEEVETPGYKLLLNVLCCRVVTKSEEIFILHLFSGEFEMTALKLEF